MALYTHIKGVQIIISLLKQFNIRHIVLSPGTRNTALSHSVEDDAYFKCYSIVDERSAAFFALGIAEHTGEGACVSCTAATATANYLPAMREAYERNIKLIALTADRDRYGMFHMLDQCIDQVDMYHGYVKKAVSIPVVRSENDYWYANRCVNEALLEIDHHVNGPVQINYDMAYSVPQIAEFDVSRLPVTRKITRYSISDIDQSMVDEIASKKRILLFCGSNSLNVQNVKKEVLEFATRFNCAVICDNYANIYDHNNPYLINPGALNEVASRKEKLTLKPDLIISFGNIYYCTSKALVAKFAKDTVHWEISIDGYINDGFRCLQKVFEGRPEEFFTIINKLSVSKNTQNDGKYFNQWKAVVNRIQIGSIPFTHFKVIREFCARIPENSIFHASVLNAIRLSNYSEIRDNVYCFANSGADGIDGALSTFFGQANGEKELAFLLIGDLSLLYDANALLTNIPENIRILVINNYAGAEFYRNFGREINTVYKFIAARHKTKILHCAPMLDAEYYSAWDMKSLQTAFKQFFSAEGSAKILEVFTDADTDAKTLNYYWDSNKNYEFKDQIKNNVKKIIGSKRLKKIKKIGRK